MRNFMLALAAIMMSAMFVPNAAKAAPAASQNGAASTVAQDFVHKATWYKKRNRYGRHHYGYDRYDRYERRHYRKRHLRHKLRRFKRMLRHRFHDRDYRRYDRDWH